MEGRPSSAPRSPAIQTAKLVSSRSNSTISEPTSESELGTSLHSKSEVLPLSNGWFGGAAPPVKDTDTTTGAVTGQREEADIRTARETTHERPAGVAPIVFPDEGGTSPRPASSQCSSFEPIEARTADSSTDLKLSKETIESAVRSASQSSLMHTAESTSLQAADVPLRPLSIPPLSTQQVPAQQRTSGQLPISAPVQPAPISPSTAWAVVQPGVPPRIVPGKQDSRQQELTDAQNKGLQTLNKNKSLFGSSKKPPPVPTSNVRSEKTHKFRRFVPFTGVGRPVVTPLNTAAGVTSAASKTPVGISSRQRTPYKATTQRSTPRLCETAKEKSSKSKKSFKESIKRLLSKKSSKSRSKPKSKKSETNVELAAATAFEKSDKEKPKVHTVTANFTMDLRTAKSPGLSTARYRSLKSGSDNSRRKTNNRRSEQIGSPFDIDAAFESLEQLSRDVITAREKVERVRLDVPVSDLSKSLCTSGSSTASNVETAREDRARTGVRTKSSKSDVRSGRETPTKGVRTALSFGTPMIMYQKRKPGEGTKETSTKNVETAARRSLVTRMNFGGCPPGILSKPEDILADSPTTDVETARFAYTLTHDKIDSPEKDVKTAFYAYDNTIRQDKQQKAGSTKKARHSKSDRGARTPSPGATLVRTSSPHLVTCMSPDVKSDIRSGRVAHRRPFPSKSPSYDSVHTAREKRSTSIGRTNRTDPDASREQLPYSARYPKGLSKGFRAPQRKTSYATPSKSPIPDDRSAKGLSSTRTAFSSQHSAGLYSNKDTLSSSLSVGPAMPALSVAHTDSGVPQMVLQVDSADGTVRVEFQLTVQMASSSQNGSHAAAPPAIDNNLKPQRVALNGLEIWNRK